MKAKLGISVGLLGALTYFAALFGGWIPVLLILGYVLLFESNIWLKKAVLNAAIIMIFFALIDYVIGFVPQFINLIDDMLNIFEEDLANPDWLLALRNFFWSLTEIIREILLILLGILAISQRTITLPFVNKFINKHTAD